MRAAAGPSIPTIIRMLTGAPGTVELAGERTPPAGSFESTTSRSTPIRSAR